MASDPAPKVYIPGEERLNVLTHALGAAASLAAAAWLTAVAENAIQTAAGLLYGASLCILFGGSALYHAAKEPGRRAKLRLLDHSAIYFLIAGTYTPLMLVAVPGKWGYSVLGFVWAVSLTGVICELLHFKPFRGFSIVLYILAGWACAAILPQLVSALGRTAFLFLLAGGIAYTAGVPFYVIRKNYFHAVWHFFVLAGAVLQFVCVLMTYRP